MILAMIQAPTIRQDDLEPHVASFPNMIQQFFQVQFCLKCLRFSGSMAFRVFLISPCEVAEGFNEPRGTQAGSHKWTSCNFGLPQRPSSAAPCQQRQKASRVRSALVHSARSELRACMASEISRGLRCSELIA